MEEALVTYGWMIYGAKEAKAASLTVITADGAMKTAIMMKMLASNVKVL